MRLTAPICFAILGLVLATPRAHADELLDLPRPTPAAPDTTVDYLSGTQWTLDAAGALINSAPVTLMLSLDAGRGRMSRVVIAAAQTAAAAHTTTHFTIRSLHRSSGSLTLTATARAETGDTVLLNLTARGGAVSMHAVTRTATGTVVRREVYVAARVARLHVDQDLGSLTSSMAGEMLVARQ